MFDFAGDSAGNRAAVVWSVLSREIDRYREDTGRPALSIVDVGGGSGAFAVPLAQLGHTVTVVDPSANALASLAQRVEECEVDGKVTALQGDIDELPTLVADGTADMVLCHNVLESVEEPEDALRALSDVSLPGGSVSLLVANRAAAVLAKSLGGHFNDALEILGTPDGVSGPGDTVRHRFETATLTALVGSAGLATEQVHGVGVVDEYLPTAVGGGDRDSAGDLYRLERAIAARVPFRDIASRLHLLARKRKV
ncbi:class I SAM-dependent methyltransferase [Salininema proteolyticum]|uniref:Class I SAM-dependent methyltransferase n=1 Tax=Salininema proteolyticum TaxID=1607685 RepID=A0ABV8TVC9_9ACTN